MHIWQASNMSGNTPFTHSSHRHWGNGGSAICGCQLELLGVLFKECNA